MRKKKKSSEKMYFGENKVIQKNVQKIRMVNEFEKKKKDGQK